MRAQGPGAGLFSPNASSPPPLNPNPQSAAQSGHGHPPQSRGFQPGVVYTDGRVVRSPNKNMRHGREEAMPASSQVGRIPDEVVNAEPVKPTPHETYFECLANPLIRHYAVGRRQLVQARSGGTPRQAQPARGERS